MTRIVGGCEPGASGMVGSGMGTVRVRTEERVHVRELACACSAGAGEYWSKQPFAHLFATKCAANATFYGSGVTLWISGDTGCTTATSTWVLADLLRQSASPPALRLCGHEYPLLLLLTGPFSSPTDHHRSCCLRYQLSGCCNGSYRKDLAPNVDPAFRRRYFRRRRSTRPELYAMNTRRSTRPLCLVWRLPRRGGVLGICSTWQCHSTSLLSLPRLASSR